MRFGLALPHYDFSYPGGKPVSWDRLAETARRAEALGFDSVWVSDHFFLSPARYGGADEPSGSAEPLTTLAALATVTERVRLGTLVLAAGFRHPALLAKSAVTIDLLSGGRLDLGLGAGWYEDEYRAFGYDFGSVGDRFEILAETLEVLALMFGEDGPVTWTGNRFRLDAAYCRPRPAQDPGPPLWLGGKGGPTLLRLVARLADGWNTVWAWTPQAYGERAAALDRMCEQEGRDPGSVRRSVGLYTIVGADQRDFDHRWDAVRRSGPEGAMDGVTPEDWGRDKLVGTPDRVLELVGAFAAHGVDELIVGPGFLPFSLPDPEMLDVLGEAILPAARGL
jgi:probable F420-dependent oxidoreductase